MCDVVWDAIFKEPEFLEEIFTNGRSKERKFSEYKSKHNLKLTGFTPKYISIDFYSRQFKGLWCKNDIFTV